MTTEQFAEFEAKAQKLDQERRNRIDDKNAALQRNLVAIERIMVSEGTKDDFESWLDEITKATQVKIDALSKAHKEVLDKVELPPPEEKKKEPQPGEAPPAPEQ